MRLTGCRVTWDYIAGRANAQPRSCSPVHLGGKLSHGEEPPIIRPSKPINVVRVRVSWSFLLISSALAVAEHTSKGAVLDSDDCGWWSFTMVEETAIDLDTNHIKQWRSIVTLVVFVITNVIVLFPFHIPIYIPRSVADAFLNALSTWRIISPRNTGGRHGSEDDNGKFKPFVRLKFPLNFVTAPLIGDLFLLAILAIGRKEVHDGTIGSNHISPIDIMAFFMSLAYIAISIDASGLIRYLAFKVLQWGGDVGHRLFFYLYAFFFALTAFIGNDPVILSGTAFLAYMTRVSSNIVHPRAWIHAQFAVANIGSAILVSSNPTNLVLAGAFNIKFINYTANIIVPVVVTAIVLFPFLLYIVFANESLIPYSIKMHELPQEVRDRKPVNPNIPHARGKDEEQEINAANDEPGQLLSLEEIMNPFLDKGGAAFGGVVMAVTLITLLSLNAATQSTYPRPVYWVTLPGAFVMFCWDVCFGWVHRHETRDISRKGRREFETARAERAARGQGGQDAILMYEPVLPALAQTYSPEVQPHAESRAGSSKSKMANADDERQELTPTVSNNPPQGLLITIPNGEVDEKKPEMNLNFSNQGSVLQERPPSQTPEPQTLVSLITELWRWLQETFPTSTTVAAHLPYALVPFAFSMFVLVQALVTKGWVPVFAYGWDHWVNKTGTVGAIGGMGFLSVILCNFAGTNIGTTILLCRVIQAWQQIHTKNGTTITDRTFWATVYSMALGVNYGAFSAAFSASLAGLLWRDILARKHIRVHRLDFARVNLPIIAIAMTVGCVVLVGQIYIIRSDDPYYARR
ncbi:uncharacterized protein BDR25DRAFT_371924 [Lindgomyces ingoldianus]|uniref:Uncharacterized protein n=1 Tax=Lindgomyces ingoldianus TaxID=673940 RepID=A0ACB6QST9_9PLEO|nr:uncharacterized protein BDR25DRAFT_371924 [Lindgomyces ingoldianus]KAF2469362.1 hypothetical protein BDR25DRAFT_371924 [Lindgomyces ingoldianus]